MQGYKHVVDNPKHRKEVVAGNLGEHLTRRMNYILHSLISSHPVQCLRALQLASGTMLLTLGKCDATIFSATASLSPPFCGNHYENYRRYALLLLGGRHDLKSRYQIVFTLRAVQYPASIPLSLASLTLINQTARSFSATVFGLWGVSLSLAEQFANVRKLYEISTIPNRIVDGTKPFPENQQALRNGIALEFR